jgi:indole-3-glycerol phosphate synthase
MTAGGQDILTRIADDRRRRIEAMKLEVPGHTLRARLGTPRPAGRLERALRRGGPEGAIRLICEVKRASPSRGVLNAALDPVAIAKTYAAGGAAAISVVTEPDHFQGEIEWVDAIRATTSLPLLLKDFVVDGYQLLDAAARGADAVLLIAAMHSDVLLQRLVTEALLLGLDALVEVHDEIELRRAVTAGANLVGINNRDLRTFEVDLGTSMRLLPLVPPLVTAVAESGLSAPDDLRALRATRCDAVLMGEVFMSSAAPATALASLAAAARG